MEQVVFIISILSLAVALILFIGRVLTSGLGKAFEMKSKSTKYMLSSFFLYIISFALYILISNS
ncbi:Mas-related G-protein coupled receptor member D [Paenibacillus donghaensis]|uniref:Mas-related G-protein coupled receptor member D n=1 Tax=Paenibacillus donghaensis TaxID=414771 RepID=A0A2Z2KKT9_9BACL|nr:Mas-related G-protein coupled receptor member D [Paenibacillus donghaensis]